MIGILAELDIARDICRQLQMIQHRLFDIGAELATPNDTTICAKDTLQLEEWILQHSAAIPPLKQFVLPGGTISGGGFHLARSICRRAERTIVGLSEDTNVNPDTLCYINRLSDLLFVLSRAVTLQSGKKEIVWDNSRFKK